MPAQLLTCLSGQQAAPTKGATPFVAGAIDEVGCGALSLDGLTEHLQIYIMSKVYYSAQSQPSRGEEHPRPLVRCLGVPLHEAA